MDKGLILVDKKNYIIHNVRVAPFIEFPTGGGLSLFNAFTAFMWFEAAGRLLSLAPVLLPGRLFCFRAGCRPRT